MISEAIKKSFMSMVIQYVQGRLRGKQRYHSRQNEKNVITKSSRIQIDLSHIDMVFIPSISKSVRYAGRYSRMKIRQKSIYTNYIQMNLELTRIFESFSTRPIRVFFVLQSQSSIKKTNKNNEIF